MYLTVEEIDLKHKSKLKKYKFDDLVLGIFNGLNSLTPENINEKYCLIIFADYYKYELNDIKKYESFLLMACNLFSVTAIIKLGLHYLHLKKYDLALEYFLLAYESGDVVILFDIGFLFGNILKNYEKAKEWYFKGCENGCSKCMHNLAMIYLTIDKDDVLAKKYFLESAIKNDIKSMIYVAFVHDIDEVLAKDYFIKAIEQDEKMVMIRLVEYFRENRTNNKFENENIKKHIDESDDESEDETNNDTNNYTNNTFTNNDNTNNTFNNDNNTNNTNNTFTNNNDTNNTFTNNDGTDTKIIIYKNFKESRINLCLSLILKQSKSSYNTLLINIRSNNKHYEFFHQEASKLEYSYSTYKLGKFYEKQ